MLRKPLFLTIVLSAVLLAIALPRLRISSDVLGLLPRHLPELDSLLALRSNFQDENDLTIGVHHAEASVVEEASESLGQALRRATTVTGRIRGDSLSNDLQDASESLGWMVANASPEKMNEFRRRLSPENLPAHLAEVVEAIGGSMDMAEVQRKQYDPFGLFDTIELNLTGQDSGPFSKLMQGGTLRLIEVGPTRELPGYKVAHKWMTELRGVLDHWKHEWQAAGHPLPDLWITGEPAFMAETGIGIEKDFTGTLLVSFVLIALVFWLILRTLKPLFYSMLMVAITVAITAALGGFLFGSITAMSMGFAAVVQGLVVDYSALIYFHSLRHPELNASGLRRVCRRSILGGALTTSIVFGATAFGSFPGLRQFGILVAAGTLIGAALMLWLFTTLIPDLTAKNQLTMTARPVGPSGRVFGLSVMFLLAAVSVLFFKGLPRFDPSTSTMRPRNSEALPAWENIQDSLGKEGELFLPILIRGKDPEALLKECSHSAPKLGEIAKAADGHFWLPNSLIPNAKYQEANRDTIQWIVGERERLRQTASTAGLTDEALSLFSHVADWWSSDFLSSSSRSASLPNLIKRGIAHDKNGWYAIGGLTLKRPFPDRFSAAYQNWMSEKVKGTQKMLGEISPNISLTGWLPLGPAISAVARKDLAVQAVPILLVILITLLVVFRNWRDLLLCFSSLGLSLTGTLALLSLFNRPVNMANLAAFPLIAGTGIDYTIHVLLGLERHRDIQEVRRVIGRAITFCAISTIIGFGSLLLAGNRGVWDLGLACCLGLSLSFTIAVGILPHWWRLLNSRRLGEPAQPEIS